MSNVPSDEDIKKTAAQLVAHNAGSYTAAQEEAYTKALLKIRDDTKRAVAADMKKIRELTMKRACLEAFDRVIASHHPAHIVAVGHKILRKYLEAEL